VSRCLLLRPISATVQTAVPRDSSRRSKII
jgi:hypothetical protein